MSDRQITFLKIGEEAADATAPDKDVSGDFGYNGFATIRDKTLRLARNLGGGRGGPVTPTSTRYGSTCSTWNASTRICDDPEPDQRGSTVATPGGTVRRAVTECVGPGATRAAPRLHATIFPASSRATVSRLRDPVPVAELVVAREAREESASFSPSRTAMRRPDSSAQSRVPRRTIERATGRPASSSTVVLPVPASRVQSAFNASTGMSRDRAAPLENPAAVASPERGAGAWVASRPSAARHPESSPDATSPRRLGIGHESEIGLVVPHTPADTHRLETSAYVPDPAETVPGRSRLAIDPELAAEEREVGGDGKVDGPFQPRADTHLVPGVTSILLDEGTGPGIGEPLQRIQDRRRAGRVRDAGQLRLQRSGPLRRLVGERERLIPMEAVDDIPVCKGLQLEQSVDPAPPFAGHDDGVQRRAAADGRRQGLLHGSPPGRVGLLAGGEVRLVHDLEEDALGRNSCEVPCKGFPVLLDCGEEPRIMVETLLPLDAGGVPVNGIEHHRETRIQQEADRGIHESDRRRNAAGCEASKRRSGSRGRRHTVKPAFLRKAASSGRKAAA